MKYIPTELPVFWSVIHGFMLQGEESSTAMFQVTLIESWIKFLFHMNLICNSLSEKLNMGHVSKLNRCLQLCHLVKFEHTLVLASRGFFELWESLVKKLYSTLYWYKQVYEKWHIRSAIHSISQHWSTVSNALIKQVSPTSTKQQGVELLGLFSQIIQVSWAEDIEQIKTAEVDSYYLNSAYFSKMLLPRPKKMDLKNNYLISTNWKKK